MFPINWKLGLFTGHFEFLMLLKHQVEKVKVTILSWMIYHNYQEEIRLLLQNRGKGTMFKAQSNRGYHSILPYLAVLRKLY